MGSAFVRCLLAAPAARRRPSAELMRPLAGIGGHILMRTGALLASFTVASAVVARFGAASLAAHQIAIQMFIFLALVLDAIAVAGQVMVGRSLGAGDADGAVAAARRMILGSLMVGTAFAAMLLALIDVLPTAFSDDHQVLDRAREVWPLFALMQPAGGIVFALDGILIGAGDARFLAWSMLGASALAFIPIALASLAFGWGIVGVWCGLLALMAARLGACGQRFLGRRWVRTGLPGQDAPAMA
jgi:putative MATE family efflux protein